MPSRMSVSSADFIRNIGHWQNEALRAPVVITHHGRDRLVLVAPDQLRPPAAELDGAHAKDMATLRTDLFAISENMDEGFLAFDHALTVQGSNRIAQTFVGQTQSELLGQSVLDIMPQPLASSLSDRLRRVLRSRSPERLEAGAFDGRYLSITLFPISGGVAAVFTNTTEQHSVRRRVDEADAVRNALHHHPRTVLITIDPRGRITEISAQIKALSEFEPGDLAGHRFVDLIAASQRRAVSDLVERVLRDAKPDNVAVTLLTKRGGEIRGSISAAPILSDFAVNGVTAVFIAGDEASYA